jgi:hypothetical protein
MVEKSDEKALLDLAAQPEHKGSGAALWMLLLLRLTSVASDQRVELRNSEFFFFFFSHSNMPVRRMYLE